jgi:hypothetical protein
MAVRTSVGILVTAPNPKGAIFSLVAVLRDEVYIMVGYVEHIQSTLVSGVGVVDPAVLSFRKKLMPGASDMDQ